MKHTKNEWGRLFGKHTHVCKVIAKMFQDFSCTDGNLEKQRISVFLPGTAIWKGLPWVLNRNYG